jgi:type VI secretion system secreted protein VgrG
MAAQAQSDLTTAYNSAAAQPCTTDETGQTLGGTVGTSGSPLGPGVYCFSSSAQVTGDLYLSGAGVYIFKVGSTLVTASGKKFFLAGGASVCQIYWQVGSSATLGTASQFDGSILALTDITVTHGVVVQGRALARNGQVTLDDDTITRPACGEAPTSTSLVSSTNPAKAGQPVTFTATVTGATSGSVSFYDGTTLLATGAVDTSGQASLTISSLSAGTHNITAVYSGSAGHLPSTSSTVTETITAAPSPTPSPSATPRLPLAGTGATPPAAPGVPLAGAGAGLLALLLPALIVKSCRARQRGASTP